MDDLGYSNIFQNCIENILAAEKQVQDKNTITSQIYKTLDEFWKEIDIISKKLSFECTKLCISFSSAPLPSSAETSSLLQSIEHAIIALISVFYKFDPSFGRVLHDDVIRCTTNAIQKTRQLIRIIKDDGQTGVNERYLQATGIAWEGCKALENCPKNNKEAVVALLKEQCSLVNDAFDEISEALEGDGGGWNNLGISTSDSEEVEEEEPTWSDEDKETLTPAVNIIKAAKVLYKKILLAINKNGSCVDQASVKELDQFLDDCTPVSQTIDSLILELYPPLSVANMKTQSHTLAEHLHTALKTAAKSHVVTETEKPTVEFIQTAVDHNLNKMKETLRKL